MLSKIGKKNWGAKLKPFLTKNVHYKVRQKVLGKSLEPFLRPGTNKAQPFRPISIQCGYSSFNGMELLCLIRTCPLLVSRVLCLNFQSDFELQMVHQKWLQLCPPIFLAYFWHPRWCDLKMNIYFHASRRIYFIQIFWNFMQYNSKLAAKAISF